MCVNSLSGNSQYLIAQEDALLAPTDKEKQCREGMQTDFTTEVFMLRVFPISNKCMKKWCGTLHSTSWGKKAKLNLLQAIAAYLYLFLLGWSTNIFGHLFLLLVFKKVPRAHCWDRHDVAHLALFYIKFGSQVGNCVRKAFFLMQFLKIWIPVLRPAPQPCLHRAVSSPASPMFKELSLS